MKITAYAIVFVIALVVAVNSESDSPFFTVSLGVASGVMLLLVEQTSRHFQRLRLWLTVRLLHRGKTLRFSISYLVRIKIDDEYLLAYSDRFGRFQPVGGVYKASSGAEEFFEAQHIGQDEKIPIDDNTRHDLRRFVPSRAGPADA